MKCVIILICNVANICTSFGLKVRNINIDIILCCFSNFGFEISICNTKNNKLNMKGGNLSNCIVLHTFDLL